MIKRITGQNIQQVPAPNQEWLNLDVLVQVEVTSEDAEHPSSQACYPVTIPVGGQRKRDRRPCASSLTNRKESDVYS